VSRTSSVAGKLITRPLTLACAAAVLIAGGTWVATHQQQLQLVSSCASGYGSPGGHCGPFVPLPQGNLFTRRHISGGHSISVGVAGHDGVPASAIAVLINVAARTGQHDALLRVYPYGHSRPGFPSLNVPAHATRSNVVELPPGRGGRVSFYASSSVTASASVMGYVSSSSVRGGLFVPRRSRRIATKNHVTHHLFTVHVLGRGGVPSSGVRAVVLNLTVSGKPTTVTAYPNGGRRPRHPDLYLSSSQATDTRQVVVKVGSGGKVAVFTSGGPDSIAVDVHGFFTGTTSGSGAQFHTLRAATLSTVTVPAHGTVVVAVAGHRGVPSGSTAAVLNFTDKAVRGTYLTGLPNGSARPGIADIYAPKGLSQSDFDIAQLGSNGKVSIHSSRGRVRVTIGVEGYYK
jgi:hypothetical protein